MIPAPDKIVPYDCGPGSDFLPKLEVMKASAAVNNGEALKRTSAASTVERAATNAVFTGVYAGADRAASLTDTPKKEVYRIDNGQRFIFPVGDGGSTAMVRGDLVDFDGGSYSAVDLAASTNDDVIFEEAYSWNAAGTHITSFIGRFNPANIEA